MDGGQQRALLGEQHQEQQTQLLSMHPEQDCFTESALLVAGTSLVAGAAELSRQQQDSRQQEPVLQWRSFALRQVQRYVPALPDPSRRAVHESVCYRLRVLHVDNLPPLSFGVQYGLQLGVTLFDASLGQPYGSTCCSVVKDLQQQADDGASQQHTVAFDVLFHTVICDPRCVAVVELILAEKDDDGSCKTKFSAGWAQVQLFTHAAKGSDVALPNSQPAASQTTVTVPVMCGTPRYLQLRAVSGDQMLPSPAMLGSCTMTCQIEAYPAMDPAKALLPQDFLVCYTDVIPGLRRFDLAGHPTTVVKSILNTLANPLLAPTCAVSLAGIQLLVPQLLHNLLSVLPELVGAVPPPELATLLSVPCQPEAVAYSLRLRVHNGRTFVGPWVTTQLQVQPHLGSLALSPHSGQALALEQLCQDRLVVLVLELLAIPSPAACTSEDDGVAASPPSTAVLVGRSVLAPFAEVATDGSLARLAEGRHAIAFDSCSCLGACSPSHSSSGSSCGLAALAASPCSHLAADDLLLLPPLNWRAMLSDTAARTVPDATVTFELRQGGSTQQPPMVFAREAAPAPAPTAASSSAVTSCATGREVDVSLRTGSTQQEQPASSLLEPPLPAAEAMATSVLAPLQQDLAAASLQLQGLHETPAARSLQQAARHLEEAANIPVETPSSTTCGGRLSQEAADQQADTASQQQLRQLANAMQQQLDMLAQAVAELRQERQTLRSSLTVLQPTPAVPGGQRFDSRPQHAADPTSSSSNPTEQAAGLPSTAALSGQVGQHAHQQGCMPSRTVLQQQHQAGITTRALPADTYAQLQAQNGSRAAACGGLSLLQQQQQQPPQHIAHHERSHVAALDVEAQDQRTAADVVVQLLAFRPSADPAAVMQLPSSLSSIYCTLQFYNFEPIVTEVCSLAAADNAPSYATGAGSGLTWQVQQQQQQQYGNQRQGLHTAASSAARPANSGEPAVTTFLLLPPNHDSTRAGAGLVLKFAVDGSKQAELLPGQDCVQSAAAAHLAFCKYLLTHKLAVDVWNGDSLLQLGSCTADLSGLLRQGRDLSDVLLELPLLKDCSHSRTVMAPAAGQESGPTQAQVELGALVVRLINVGRVPSSNQSSSEAAPEAATPAASGKKVCVLRAAPLEPGSPVAKELRCGSSPFKADWQQQQQELSSSSVADAGDGRLGPDVNHSTDAAATACDIIGFEQRKLAREHCLRELLHSPSGSPKHNSSPGSLRWQSPAGQRSSPTGKLLAAASTWSSPSTNKQQQWRPGSPLSTWAATDPAFDAAEPFKALQQALMSDVDAVRKRQKPGFIRSQLRKSLVTRCSIRPSPGHVLLLEHSLTNMLGREAVFELRVSHPQEVSAVQSWQELADLQRVVGAGINTAMTPAAADSSAQSASGGAAAAVLGATAQGTSGGCAMLGLKQLAQQASASGSARQLVNRGRILVKADETVSVALRFTLQDSTCCSSSLGAVEQLQHHHQLYQQHTVLVEFTPVWLDWPASILELDVQPQAAVVDRSLRYHCPEQELLHVELGLTDLPGVSAAVLAAAARGQLAVVASRPDVSVEVMATQQQSRMVVDAASAYRQPSGYQDQQQQMQSLCLRHRCGAAHEGTVQFYVWLYGDAAMAQPLETWQVCVHPLQRVDMHATVGQQSTTTLALSCGSADRLVAVYSSQPAELQPSPAVLSLPAGGGITALSLTFKPRFPGQQRVCVHVVDVKSKQLVHALLAVTDAQLPPLH